MILRSLAILLLAAACDSAGPADRPDAQPDAGSTDAAPPDSGAPDSGAMPDAGSPEPALCPEDAALVHYSLAAPTNLPPLDAIDLPNLLRNTDIAAAGDGESNSIRFDLCENATGPALSALLYRGNEFEAAIRYVVDGSITAPEERYIQIREGFVMELRLPPSAVAVEGLADAIAGDPRALRIRLMHESGLLVVGHADFVAAARGRVGATSIQYTSLTVIVGRIIAGDVFAALRCPFGEQTHSATFSLGTADFSVEACTFLGGGFTTGYRINRLSVRDSSAELTESERALFELVGEAQVEEVMNYGWNHHNACDSFHLALPHADYAASAGPAAGCGPQVPNAPERSFEEPDGAPVLYRVRYHGSDWTEGSIPGCRHYLFCP